jgi:OHCU decarboxylase
MKEASLVHKPGSLTHDEFVKIYAGIYEHSPWVAEGAYGQLKGDSVSDLHTAMKRVVDAALEERKLALIRAHPDLGVSTAEATALTASSTSEQKGAGLMQCSAEEFAEFRELNARYKERFGFPFIIAVKGLSRLDILEAFRERIENDKEQEYNMAIEQIHKIALLRLAELAE